MSALALLLAATEIVGGVSLISILIWLLVFLIVCYIVYLILGHMPIPDPWKTVILCIVGLILLLILLSRFGFF
jgi:hypothetical protein